MRMHEGNLSRFPLTILDVSSGSPRYVSANIPWNEVSCIREKITRAGLLKDLIKAVKDPDCPSGREGTPADCVTLLIGPFKGRTPVQVLKNDPSDAGKLLGTREFLLKKAQQFPVNQKQIQAIDEALSLFESGRLEETPEQSPLVRNMQHGYVIYERRFKNKKPYEADRRTIYDIRIECVYSNDRYPWKISISNCMAPGRINSRGVWLPAMEEAENKVSLCVNLSDDGWIECSDIMYRRLRQFENGLFPEQLRRMNELAWKPKQSDAREGCVSIGATCDGGLGIAVTDDTPAKDGAALQNGYQEYAYA